MLVLTYSITPKIVLHNLVANHIDSGKVLSHHADELSASGYNCKCDNLVVSSPYVSVDFSFKIVQISFTRSFVQELISYNSSERIYSQLRGPPTFL